MKFLDQAKIFVRSGDGGAGSRRRFRAEVHDGWDISGNANGGYVLAIAGRAMTAAMGRPPLTVTAHYLAPAPPGPCEVIVTTVRPGGRLATCTASLVQSGRELIRVLGTFGTPADRGHRYIDGAPPIFEDDWLGLVGHARLVSRESVEDYVAAAVAAGPVRAAAPRESSK